MNKFLLLTFLLFIATNTIAQNKKLLDSLNVVYSKAKDDTTKTHLLIEIASIYEKNKLDTALVIAQKTFLASQKVNYRLGEARSLYLIGRSFYNKSNYSSAINYLQQSLKIAEALSYKDGISLNCNSLGNIFTFQANYSLALSYYLKSLALKEAANEKTGMSILYNNIGNIHKNQHNLDLALEYYHKSLKIKEELKDKQGTAASLGNIANVYIDQEKYSLGIEFHKKGLALKEELKDKKGISTTFNNLGYAYEKLENYTLALEYYQKGLQLKEELKDAYGIAYALRGIGEIHINNEEYDKGIENVSKALQIAKDLEALHEIHVCSSLLYSAYKLKGDYAKALEYHELTKLTKDSIFNVEKSKSIANLESRMALEKKEKEFTLLAKDNELNKLAAEKQARELEITKKQAEAEQLLSLARAEKDKRKQDSLYNLAQQAKLEAENLKTKEEKNKLEAEKEKLAHLAELEQQKRIRNTFLGLAVTALLVIVLVAVGYYQKQKSNRLLAQQNDAIKSQNQEITRQQTEIAEKNNELSQANEELFQQQEELKVLNENLESQKQEIENTYTQLKSTSDALGKSISYASSIQNIILADQEQLLSFFSEVFILYKPRDVVSGDFYWFSKISDTQSVFVLADCTGHGVPGAFMSMLGSTLLDEAVNERNLYASPADILKFLHQRLRKMLKQGEGKNTDGMDISIVYFEKTPTTTQVRFSGAKSNVYYITDNQLHILDGDRIYLGGKKPTAEFTNKEVSLNNTTIFYFFSDGFADQNNAERQKFGSKNLQDLLFAGYNLPLEQQKNMLEAKLQAHQGEEPQRDDISVVGLKI